MLDAIANGMRPWFSKFSATLHDERWLKGVEDIYLWTEKNQRYLTHQQPLARVGLVYSQQTALVLRRRPRRRPRSRTTRSAGIRR